jgi:hypothetical protein
MNFDLLDPASCGEIPLCMPQENEDGIRQKSGSWSHRSGTTHAAMLITPGGLSGDYGDEREDELSEMPEIDIPGVGKYTGQWRGRMRHGLGVLVRADGYRYEGYFAEGRCHGQGAFHAPNGSIYDGQWEQDKAHGQGKYTHADGSTFDGQWLHDEKSGRGIEHWSDGAFYEGPQGELTAKILTKFVTDFEAKVLTRKQLKKN